MTSAPFSPNLRFCVVWLCGLEITPKTSPWTLTFKVQHGPNSSFESETGNKASGMAPARTLERMNIKSQEAFWFITAFYEYVCRDVKPHRAVSFFLFFFLYLHRVSLKRECFAISLKIIFYDLRGNTDRIFAADLCLRHMHKVLHFIGSELRVYTLMIYCSPTSAPIKFVFPHSISANQETFHGQFRNYITLMITFFQPSTGRINLSNGYLYLPSKKLFL